MDSEVILLAARLGRAGPTIKVYPLQVEVHYVKGVLPDVDVVVVAVRQLQERLGIVKACAGCRHILPVSEFLEFGAACCAACVIDPMVASRNMQPVSFLPPDC